MKPTHSLRAEYGRKILLEPTSGFFEVGRKKLAQTWLEGKKWAELDKEDWDEKWTTMSSEKTLMGEWVDLGLRDSGQQSDP